MRLDTGEITDKIWLNANYYFAKNFFEIRKSMIDRAVGKKPRIVEFEKRNYYNVEDCCRSNVAEDIYTPFIGERM
jgi:hypothetical protein